MDTAHARPGFLLRGAALAGLFTWAGLLFLLAILPGVELATYVSALLMTALFAILATLQNASEIRAGPDGLTSRSFLRALRCSWAGVARARRVTTLPGMTIWLVPTHAGTVVFSSLWRGHRELVAAIERHAAHDRG